MGRLTAAGAARAGRLALLAVVLGREAVTLAPGAARPPYPPSAVITGITWDRASLVRAAPGSDLWPAAWAAAGDLYTAWGDGGGFGGTDRDGRVSMGVARVTGIPPRVRGANVFGGQAPEAPATLAGKPAGLLAIGDTLFMSVVRQDTWDRGRICRSGDRARTWACTGWDFERPLHGLSFLTFGRGYAAARDGFVYAYNSDGATAIALARAPLAGILRRDAWEVFAGADGGAPRWTRDLRRRRPVFVDPNGTGWAPRATYHPAACRYLLTAHHDEAGGWGLFDAPEPWGAWTTVAYYDRWLDGVFKFGFTLTQKWMSADGRRIAMIFSGTRAWDAFNLLTATLDLAPAAPRCQAARGSDSPAAEPDLTP